MTNKRKALVTGGAGFLGSHLSRRLLSEGYEVTVLDNLSSGKKANLDDLIGKSGFYFVEHDITKSFGGKYDEIYNLACPASPPFYQNHSLQTLYTSIDGMRNVLENARLTGAKVLQASTSEIYGDPLVHPQDENYWGNVNTVGVRSCYDEGKRVAETLAFEYRRNFDVDVRLMRIFNTYGPYMLPDDGRVVTNFIMEALKNKPITIYGDGKQTRSFQYVDDLIEAMLLFMAKSKAECDEFFKALPILNLGNPGEFTMIELAEKVIELTSSKSEISFLPLPGDDPKKRRPDITKAKSFLGWEPKVALEEGLKSTIAYFKNK